MTRNFIFALCVFLPFFVLECNSVNCNNRSERTLIVSDTLNEIFDVVEVSAKYNRAKSESKSTENWIKAVKKFAKKQGKQNLSVQKKAFITIVIYKDGSIGEVKLVKSCGITELDEFAILCGQNLKKWTPAKHNGKKVNSRIKMSVYLYE